MYCFLLFSSKMGISFTKAMLLSDIDMARSSIHRIILILSIYKQTYFFSPLSYTNYVSRYLSVYANRRTRGIKPLELPVLRSLATETYFNNIYPCKCVLQFSAPHQVRNNCCWMISCAPSTSILTMFSAGKISLISPTPWPAYMTMLSISPCVASFGAVPAKRGISFSWQW